MKKLQVNHDFMKSSNNDWINIQEKINEIIDRLEYFCPHYSGDCSYCLQNLQIRKSTK